MIEARRLKNVVIFIQTILNNIPIRNNLLEPIVGVSKNIRTKKNAAVEALEGKQTHDIFEYFVN